MVRGRQEAEAARMELLAVLMGMPHTRESAPEPYNPAVLASLQQAQQGGG